MLQCRTCIGGHHVHAGVKILHDINNFTRSRTVVSVDKIEYEREDILVSSYPLATTRYL